MIWAVDDVSPLHKWLTSFAPIPFAARDFRANHAAYSAR